MSFKIGKSQINGKIATRKDLHMILSFTIENFRSFKERSVLTFEASGNKSHNASHIFTSPSGQQVLKSAGLYGANASGKSNFLLAFDALKYLVVKTGSLTEGKKIACYEPYRLCEDTKHAPIKFELEFLNRDNVKFIYKISYLANKILSESLDFYPSRAKANIFTREEGQTWEDIKFGSLYKGGLRKIPFFDNNSYLSKAGNNAAGSELMRGLFKFFDEQICYLPTFHQLILSSKNDDSQEILSRAASILKYVDTGINDVKMVQQEVKIPEFMNAFPEEIKQNYIDSNTDQFQFTHVGETGFEEVFEDKFESDGTLKIFNMLPLLLGAFEKRMVFVIDELDNGLHAHMADFVIRLFNDKTINKVGSQLIFTTHNLNIMSHEKMRRDQIWFVEKEKGASRCFSLDDFDKKRVTASSPFGLWYDEGRFGGVPLINYTQIKRLIIDYNKGKGLENNELNLDDDSKE
ncbi:AAA family ATPase [Salmonella enterica]|uniref:AAA family ATPase n=1 Tax=Salmonella enterica TaxID=28901 RepID=UPI0010592560|nr:ATP-binding protein [Salmonella enterica]